MLSCRRRVSEAKSTKVKTAGGGDDWIFALITVNAPSVAAWLISRSPHEAHILRPGHDVQGRRDAGACSTTLATSVTM